MFLLVAEMTSTFTREEVDEAATALRPEACAPDLPHRPHAVAGAPERDRGGGRGKAGQVPYGASKNLLASCSTPVSVWTGTLTLALGDAACWARSHPTSLRQSGEAEPAGLPPPAPSELRAPERESSDGF